MESSSCIHHWVIKFTPGKTSSGVCRKCGAARDDFPNGYDDQPDQFYRAQQAAVAAGYSPRIVGRRNV